MSIQFSALAFRGEDCATFLQGQLTADINNLAMLDHSVKDQGLAGICNTKGRLIADMWVIRIADDHIVMLLPAEMAKRVETHLGRYIFRSKVSIHIEPPTKEQLASIPKGLMIPWITEATSEKFVPQMVSLDLLKGVSFKKGCYTGQEIVARMHFLGTHKRRLAKVLSPDNKLTIGDVIKSADNKNAGDILFTTDGSEALAVLYLDHKENALTVNQHPITIETIWEDEEESDA